MLTDLQPDPSRAAETNGLVERHFAMQARRPAGIRDVDVGSLDPFLRSLLFTDGTVTRALGVQTLLPVWVEVVSQSWAAAPAQVAAPLEVAPGTGSVRRRVGIGLGSVAMPVLWAESYIVSDRLPPGFVGSLDQAPDGIGQSLHRGRLENWRELLWFGLDSPPDWVSGRKTTAILLRRLYRVVSDGKPAILISESFAIERYADAYRLAGLTAPSDDSTRSEKEGETRWQTRQR